MPTEVTHYNIQPTIELTMGVYGRDLGHVSDDVTKVLEQVRRARRAGEGTWRPYDPDSKEKQRLARLEDRAQRRVPPDEGHVQQPGASA